MGLFDLFRKKSKYKVLADKGFSYVTTDSGEPLLTYYRQKSGLFCSTKINEDDIPFFLNIRRPVIFDMTDVASFYMPDDLPDECDGIIFLNYGIHKIKAFYVKDKNTQTMRAEM